jgi:hypothetical protein
VQKFAKKARKLPEVRLVSYQNGEIVVIADRPTAKTYLKLNALCAQANRHLLHGAPLHMTVRESVSPEEHRSLITSVGLQYVRDDA